MPELPEVETVKRGIQTMVGQQITNLIIRHYGLRYPVSKTLPQQLMGKQIKSITRRAKYLILELNVGYVIIHLGMSGSISMLEKLLQIPVKKHDHIDINGETHLIRFNDPRRFGLVMYIEDLENCTLLNKLGPEPLHDNFSANYLLEKLKNKKSSIKQLIMDNHIVVGVGNIYACESLFLAGISPLRLGATLSLNEVTCLVSQIKQVLTLAIELGGSSLRDYKQADGNLGYFQNIHNVYGKAGDECVKCNTIILEQRLGQRNSFYCPKCQR